MYNNYNENGCLIANPNTYSVQENSICYKDEKIILCVGRFNDYIKRIDRILLCFSKVLTRVPDTKLVLVGKYDRNVRFIPKSTKTINSIINELDIPESSLCFESETTDIDKYYSHASVLLIASKNEGFPMIINEAACFGVPTVCNYIPGIEDIVLDGRNGYLVPQDDIQAMADRVCAILSDNDLRIRMGKSSKDLAKRFELDVIGEKWVTLIETTLCKKSHQEKLNIIDNHLGASVENTNMLFKNLCDEIIKMFDVFQEAHKYNAVIQPKSQVATNFYLIKESYRKYGIAVTIGKIIRKLMRI